MNHIYFFIQLWHTPIFYLKCIKLRIIITKIIVEYCLDPKNCLTIQKKSYLQGSIVQLDIMNHIHFLQKNQMVLTFGMKIKTNTLTCVMHMCLTARSQKKRNYSICIKAINTRYFILYSNWIWNRTFKINYKKFSFNKQS